jgi:tight adherence protein B
MPGMIGSIMFGMSIGFIFFRYGDRIFDAVAGRAQSISSRFYKFYLHVKNRRYLKLFDVQLPDAMSNISSALKAGCSLLLAMEVVSKEMTGPVGLEFKYVLSDVRLGASLKDALEHMCERVASDDLILVVQTVGVLKDTGGNLIEAFETIVATIRGRSRVVAKIRTITSEGMMQAYTLLAIPFCLGFVLWVISPAYLGPLIGTRAGLLLICAGMFLQVTGFLWMKKIVRVVV